MNLILNGLQSDTKRGDITLLSAADLTGKENYLLKITNDAGVAKFALPAAAADAAHYVCMSGGASGAETAAESPDLDDQCRIFIDNACNPGDMLALSTNAWGKLTKPAAGYGAGFYTFIAEEAGVAGQSLKVRRIPDRAFNI